LLPQISELFCDYNLLNFLFLRIGRQYIDWGISPNYPFTNLLARLPYALTATEKITDIADSIAFKANLPIGVGGLEAVMFTRSRFWGPSEQPTVNEIGFGGRFNLALPNFDFNIGGFYHKDLHLRFFYSIKTTLFGTLEAYTEGLLATDLQYAYNASDKQTDFSANAGFYIDFFSQTLRINAEYFYCGEETQLFIKGQSFPLFEGHNLALNLSLALFDNKFKLLFSGRYNITRDTGMLIPGMTLDIIPHLTFSLGAQYIIGSQTAGYFVENTGSNNRRIAIVLAIILKGNI